MLFPNQNIKGNGTISFMKINRKFDQGAQPPRRTAKQES